MTLTRRLILAFALLAGIVPAFAQVPAPVPALPDTERRTSYSISGTTCACNVNFALYGDSTDYQNWVEVWLNGVRVNFNDGTFGWTITSPSGPLASLVRPISDAVLTFNAVQTGTVQIVGARRPRRTTTFQENVGVPTRNFNQVLNDLTAQNREIWDKTNDMTGRGVFVPPGETMNPLPALASRASMGACFDSGGNLVPCASVPSTTIAAGGGIIFTGTGPTTISVAGLAGGPSGGLLYDSSGTTAVSNYAQIETNGVGTPTLFLGSNAPSNDDSALLIGRSPNIVSTNPAGAHAFRDESQFAVNVAGSAFAGYSTIDCAYSETGVAVTAQNHDRCFQARPSINITGTLNEYAMFWSGPNVAGAATVVPTLFHYQATQPQITGGATVTSQTAYHADTLSGAGTNYFLFGGSNPSVLNGNVYIGGLLNQTHQEVANIQFNGSTQQALALVDTFASAGTLTPVNIIRNSSVVGTISTTTVATAYNTSSDERMKNFTGRYSASEAERVIRSDPVRTFNWKRDGSPDLGWGAQTSYGVAHDLATPGSGDPGDKDFKPWGVDKGKRTPYLWAAVTDLLNRVDMLERKVRRLEAHRRH